MRSTPSPNGDNGDRDASGRFAPGNAGGPGNPHAKQASRLRAAMLQAVTAEDMNAIVTKLIELAKTGSVPAAREVLDRCLGRPVEADLVDRIEDMERLIAEGTPR